MVALSAGHHSFIQCMIARGALSTDDTKKLFNQCVQSNKGARAQEVHNTDDLKVQVYHINKSLACADFNIKAAYSPWEKTLYWGFCNITADDAARVATKLRPGEVELFFKIIEEIRASDGAILLTDAQNMASTRNMTVKENSVAIQNMHQLQWLRIVKKARNETTVVVGARSLIELSQFREWSRQFSNGRQGAVEIEVRGGEDVDRMDKEEAEGEKEEEEERPVRRRRSNRIEEENEDEDEDVVRPQSRRKVASRRG